MATKTRFAAWRKVGKLFYVKPPGWPKNAELSFTDKDDMIQWSHNARVMLREIRGKRESA